MNPYDESNTIYVNNFHADNYIVIYLLNMFYYLNIIHHYGSRFSHCSFSPYPFDGMDKDGRCVSNVITCYGKIARDVLMYRVIKIAILWVSEDQLHLTRIVGVLNSVL